jgi:hypothetical protein
MEKREADVCREFGIVIPTIQKIRKNGTKFISAFERKGSRIKRFQKPELRHIDEALLKFLSKREVTTSK